MVRLINGIAQHVNFETIPSFIYVRCLRNLNSHLQVQIPSFLYMYAHSIIFEFW